MIEVGEVLGAAGIVFNAAVQVARVVLLAAEDRKLRCLTRIELKDFSSSENVHTWSKSRIGEVCSRCGLRSGLGEEEPPRYGCMALPIVAAGKVHTDLPVAAGG